MEVDIRIQIVLMVSIEQTGPGPGNMCIAPGSCESLSHSCFSYSVDMVNPFMTVLIPLVNSISPDLPRLSLRLGLNPLADFRYHWFGISITLSSIPFTMAQIVDLSY